MVNYQGMVQEFMEKHDQYRQTGEVVLLPDDVILLRMRLIGEEYGELLSAVHNQDLVEMADATCDLLYVIYGTGVAAGISVLPKSSQLPTRLPGFPHTTTATYGLYRIASAMVEVFRALSIKQDQWGDYRHLRSSLERLVEIVEWLAVEFGLPLGELFTEVHRSNMTKGKLESNQKGGKVGKGSSFEPPDLEKILRSLHQE